MVSRFSSASLRFWILLCFFPGKLLSAVVTLDSFSISKTHEWFKLKPTVYFQCKGENKTVLPDVEKANVTYTFKGQESWQPLTNFSSEKCKRCGFYEQDTVKSDDVFDEWEFCPSEFSKSDGRYTRINDKEFNASFICPECIHHSADSSAAPATRKEKKGMHVALVIVISVLVSTVFILGMVAAYKYWLKKKRQQDHARFLKLFEDGDDIEDELGLALKEQKPERWKIQKQLMCPKMVLACCLQLSKWTLRCMDQLILLIEKENPSSFIEAPGSCSLLYSRVYSSHWFSNQDQYPDNGS